MWQLARSGPSVIMCTPGAVLRLFAVLWLHPGYIRDSHQPFSILSPTSATVPTILPELDKFVMDLTDGAALILSKFTTSIISIKTQPWM